MNKKTKDALQTAAIPVEYAVAVTMIPIISLGWIGTAFFDSGEGPVSELLYDMREGFHAPEKIYEFIDKL